MIQDFDLLILTIERDVEKLAFGMPLLRRFLSPVRTVFVASKACLARLAEAGIPQEGDRTLDENEVLEGLTLPFVRSLIQERGSDPSRTGWYFKQFVIFAYAFREDAAARYLVWDADTVPVRDLSFFNKDGEAIFDITSDLQAVYFDTIHNFIDIERQVNYSFITDHMLLEKDIVLALLAKAMGRRTIDGESFARRAIASISDAGLASNCGFSEYETYGNFASLYFPKRFATRKCSRTRMGASLFGLCPSLSQLFALSLKYSWINLESPKESDRAFHRRLKTGALRAIGFAWPPVARLLQPRRFAAYRTHLAVGEG